MHVAGVTGEDLRPRQVSGLVYGVFIIGWIQNLAGQNLRPRQISGNLIRSDERAPTQFSDLINIPLCMITGGNIPRQISGKNLCSRCFIGFGL